LAALFFVEKQHDVQFALPGSRSADLAPTARALEPGNFAHTSNSPRAHCALRPKSRVMNENARAAVTVTAPRLGARNNDKLLRCYPRPYRRAVVHVAAQHPALGDLAASFPALLFVCAVAHAGVDRQRLISKVIEGARLPELAMMARLPMWTRKLPPQAFAGPVGPLPNSAQAARQIANLLPGKECHWPRWLSFVSHAAKLGTEEFALWMARVFRDIPKRFNEDDILRFALWQWFSVRPESFAGRLILRRWNKTTNWRMAVDAVNCWLESVDLYLVLGQQEINYARVTDEEASGFEFVTLRTAKVIFEETRIFKNCIPTYAHCLQKRDRRLVSVRKSGNPCALLCVTEGKGQRRLSIEELRAPRNGMVNQELAEAVRRWFLRQDALILESDMGPFDERLCQQSWRSFWRPYWRVKGVNPMLPLHLHEDAMENLRW
jgi:hypothetical protein